MNAATQISVDDLCKLTQLRPFPDTASRLLTISKDPSSTMMDLTEVIASDPILTMQILKLANSSVYGMTAQISSIQHAGVIIGLKALKNLAISMLVGGMFDAGESKTANVRKQLLEHSLLTACIAKQMSSAMPSGFSDEAFLGGMLHDIGKLILVDHRPDDFLAVLQKSGPGQSVVVEAETFGINHVTIGEACCEAWGLPGSMIDIVADHHNAVNADQACDLKAVMVGNQLSRSWGELAQEEFDQVLSQFSVELSGTLELEQLKSSVDEEIQLMTEIRASR
ncbi:MAG: HDOD domain-containing protein [Fuerstiella sp.]